MLGPAWRRSKGRVWPLDHMLPTSESSDKLCVMIKKGKAFSDNLQNILHKINQFNNLKCELKLNLNFVLHLKEKLFEVSQPENSERLVLLRGAFVDLTGSVCRQDLSRSSDGVWLVWPLARVTPPPPPQSPPLHPSPTLPSLAPNSGACPRTPWLPWTSRDGQVASSTTPWRLRAPPWRRDRPGGWASLKHRTFFSFYALVPHLLVLKWFLFLL